jgi:hemerythrin-like metal-binding protein
MDRYGDSLALGVRSMDDEHRHLIQLFEDFVACIKEDGLNARAREIVEEALSATNDHFDHEEKLMAETDYPGLDEEQRQHRMLRLHLTTLVGDVLHSGTGKTDPVTLENLDKMYRLFTDHIDGPDRDLANFLLANGIS